jgi:dipeptidyl aminopeptidase/acylaminoacyl peptidase
MKQRLSAKILAFHGFRIILPLAILVVAALLAIPAFVYYKIAYPQKPQEPTDPSLYMLEFSDIEVPSEQGAPITGWWIPAENGSAGVLLAPGYGMTRSDALSLAAELHKREFHVFIYAQRGSAASREKSSTFGLKEAEDMRVALQFLRKGTKNKPTPVGIWGVDVGAYAALWTAASVPEVRALVADSAYASIYDFMNTCIREQFDTDNRWLQFGCRQIFRVLRIASGSFENRQLPVEQLSNCPILFITGKNRSVFVPLATDLYNRLPSKKEMLSLPESRVRLMGGSELQNYDTKVADFFERNLK